ncbi:MAG: hypothetical protein NTY41_07260, partial [Proteobacteria bacterium]|nr:hypothetical protein [Pseudomonadota bacterium]
SITTATKLAFFQQPSNTPVSAAIYPAVTVKILDAGNNLVTTSNATVTMAIGTNPASGVLSGTPTVNAVAGIATFSNLLINQAGTGYTLTASSPGLTGATSGSFNITAPVCFTDDFNRATLLETGNWTRTKGAGTTFDAEIVNSRLRLTDAAATRATAVHLNRLFPGYGNKVTAEFNYYAYNGNGADGMVIALSDASIAPVAGAFGGSLGYAQKCQNGVAGCVNDCNVAGGCPGFAGGWIGVGLDEYGNYANPTEGRIGGPGALADEIAIRGSGSNQSGYNYHARAAASGGVDSTVVQTPPAAAPGDRYRVTVDNSDGVHAYTSVDRDNTTRDGTSYVNIISAYDAKAIATQAGVPTNWFFSFTSSTGASTNIHEIDDLKVCTPNPQVVPVLDHVRIIHDGSALTCAPETITIKACANPNCDALYTGAVSLNLNTISGATWSLSNPVAFGGGQINATLTKATTGTVTLGASVTSPSSMAAICYNGATSGDCSLTFSSNACTFDAVEPTKNPSTPIFTKLAGTAFSVDVLALTAGVINTAFNSAVTVDLVDQTGVAAGSCGTNTLASPTNAPAWANGRRTYNFNYANAARDVRVRVVQTTPSVTACSSDNFAIRPTSFSVASPNANNTGNGLGAIVKAGAGFTLNATAVNAALATTTNYTGTASFNSSSNHIAAHAGAVQAGVLSGNFSSTAAGISSGTSFTYSEVGNFLLLPWSVYDDGSFAAVDRDKNPPECFGDGNKLNTINDPNDPNVKNTDGLYGCYFGNTTNTAYFGRFTPDHFAVAPAPAVPGCGTFTYFGQDGFATVFTLTAQNAGNATTNNYETSTSYAKLPLTAWSGYGFAVSTWSPSQPAGASLAASATAPTATNGSTWVSGTTTVTAKHKIIRPTNPASPTTVTVSALPVDSDGITISAAASTGSAEQRFGRLSLSTTGGPESQNLPVTVRTDYYGVSDWTGTSNTADNCTQISTANVAIGSYKSPLSSVTKCGFDPAAAPYTGTCKGTYPATATLIEGKATLELNSVGVTGSAYIALNLTGTTTDASCNATHPASTAGNLSWLQSNWCGVAGYVRDPSAQIIFGTKKSTFIYIREKY